MITGGTMTSTEKTSDRNPLPPSVTCDVCGGHDELYDTGIGLLCEDCVRDQEGA